MRQKASLARIGWPAQLVAGLVLIAVSWTLSLAGINPFARYSFYAKWAGYLLAVDAVVGLRTGGSLLRTGGRRLWLMFGSSAVVWWSFEVLNWRLGNWSYPGRETFGPVAWVVLATLAFATVLPAMAEMRDLLTSFGVCVRRPATGRRLRIAPPVAVAAGLAMFPLMLLFPRQTYPLVWVAPFLVFDGIAWLRGKCSALELLADGQPRQVLRIMLAGLCTGLFWEAWNWHATPHWVYHVPYVGFAKVFEMPLLGYLGYLPFVLAADAMWRTFSGGAGGLTDDPVTDMGHRDRPSMPPRRAPVAEESSP